jgi:predicted RNA binding protein YcfA (HicA-like mRNA interferase family)
VTSWEVIRALEREGWYEARVKGSHHHFKHLSRKGLVTVPHPRRDIPVKTLRSIERQSGVKLLWEV